MKTINLKLDSELHKQLKIQAAQLDTGLIKLITDALNALVKGKKQDDVKTTVK